MGNHYCYHSYLMGKVIEAQESPSLSTNLDMSICHSCLIHCNNVCVCLPSHTVRCLRLGRKEVTVTILEITKDCLTPWTWFCPLHPNTTSVFFLFHQLHLHLQLLPQEAIVIFTCTLNVQLRLLMVALLEGNVASFHKCRKKRAPCVITAALQPRLLHNSTPPSTPPGGLIQALKHSET